MEMFICSTYFNGVFSLLSRFPFKSGTGDIDFFATLLDTENSVAMKIKEKKCIGKAFNLNRRHVGRTLTIGTSLDYLFPNLLRFFSFRIFPVFPNLKSKINTSKFWCRWQLETLINDVSFVFKNISMIEAINGLIVFKILSSLWGDKMCNKCPIFMAFLFQFNFGKKTDSRK